MPDSATGTGPVTVHLDGRVMLITLDRPAQLNAFTHDMRTGLLDALRRAADPGVGAVVITGAGRAFSAGQDLDEVVADPDERGDRLRTEYAPVILAITELDKPVIAAVNGACAGAGLSVMAACDIRIAAERAKFVPAFIDLGLVPDAGATFLLPRVLGPGRALAWLASGRHLSAAQAHAFGLVDEVVAGEELMERVTAQAVALAARSGPAVGRTKRLLRQSATRTLADQLEAETQAQVDMKATDEHAAALAAVLASVKSTSH